MHHDAGVAGFPHSSILDQQSQLLEPEVNGVAATPALPDRVGPRVVDGVLASLPMPAGVVIPEAEME
jgi:hypothetical protein